MACPRSTKVTKCSAVPRHAHLNATQPTLCPGHSRSDQFGSLSPSESLLPELLPVLGSCWPQCCGSRAEPGALPGRQVNRASHTSSHHSSPDMTTAQMTKTAIQENGFILIFSSRQLTNPWPLTIPGAYADTLTAQLGGNNLILYTNYSVNIT